MTQFFQYTANKIYLLGVSAPSSSVVSLDSRQLRWIPACCTDGGGGGGEGDKGRIKLRTPSHTHKNYQNIVSDRILFCLCMLHVFQTLSWRHIASISTQTQNPFVLVSRCQSVNCPVIAVGFSEPAVWLWCFRACFLRRYNWMLHLKHQFSPRRNI